MIAGGNRASISYARPATTADGLADADLSFFQIARPIWPEGLETEMNLFVGFRAVFARLPRRPVILRAAASTLYRFFVNGKFCGFGPARGPHGFFRVDEWDITPSLSAGTNIVAIEVVGYNVNSYYVLNQPSFLQAEIAAGNDVLAATGHGQKAFQATILSQKVRKVERYSLPRTFTEVYHLYPGVDAWRSDPKQPIQQQRCAVSSKKQVIPRRVAYPRFEQRQPERRIMQGEVNTGVPVTKLWKPFFVTHIGPGLLGFPEQELTEVPSIELQHVKNKNVTHLEEPYSWQSPLPLPARHFDVFDFGTDLTGFIGARVTAHSASKLFLIFDETLLNGDVDFHRGGYTINIIAYDLAPGTYSLESFEPYTMRFIKFLALRGDCEISQIYLREYVNPNVWNAHFNCTDEDLNLLFAAGRETFRQNSVDLLTDCPSRERAGWLCDSYFTAGAEHSLTGGSTVEGVFFENYLLPTYYPRLPKGFLPACYPADHYNDYYGFCPNWTMWFVLQLHEYLSRSGNHEMVQAMRPKIVKLFDYFRPFQNEDGLLEKLKGDVFIEWSAANNFTQDVSYPTNMLYAAALEAAGEMYQMPAWMNQAAAIREVIRRQSFDGQFFVDNAVRKRGKLVVTRNRTETCQYYAFYFRTATPEAYGALWNVLMSDFDPARKQTQLYPDIFPSNVFMGVRLRLELLSRYGRCQQLIDESKEDLLYMAKRTGTFWEMNDTSGSLCHGFESQIVTLLYGNALGLYQVDWVNKRVHVRFGETGLQSCEGRVPVPDGAVSLRWRKRGGKLFYQVDAPAGYAVTIENKSSLRLAIIGSRYDK